MKMFEVGGCVRDEILGVPSKDIDFTVVLEDGDFQMGATAFDTMVLRLERMGFRIFLKTPEFLTVRAQFPRVKRDNFPGSAMKDQGLTADFVLARSETGYADGRRPDKVIPGTLEDDLKRRDFTMNAIAKGPDPEGRQSSVYIDPFNGRADIANQIIRAVGDPFERITEDALRAVRAVRFAVTKGFDIDPDLAWVINHNEVADLIVNKISDERIQVELSKMFRFDTLDSLQVLRDYPNLTDAMFAGKVSLDATLKTKGRGK